MIEDSPKRRDSKISVFDRVVIVLPDSTLEGRVRTRKLLEYLKDQHEVAVAHWTWNRGGKTPSEHAIEHTRVVLLRGGGYSSTRTKLLYLVWMLQVFIRSWFVGRKTLVWAVGVESALPFVPVRLIRRNRVIFDDADRTSLVLNLTPGVKKGIQILERITSSAVPVHLIPNRRRYEFTSKSFVEVKNFPAAEDVHKAWDYNIEHLKDSRLTVYINGYLEESRGLDTLLRTIHRLDDEGRTSNFRFLLAGNVRGESAQQLVSMPSVTYLGRIGLVESLAVYRACAFVLTYYDPAIPINRLAEANKWGDALKMGTPILVNSEVATADWLLENGCALSAPYADDRGLASLLCSTSTRQIEVMKDRCLRLGHTFPSFDDRLEDVLSKATEAT